MKVAALKAKFETLAKSMARDDDDDDDGSGPSERSQAYYVIKAAQKREELQREGDELDSKIRTAEREIRALEATLHHLVDRNQEFRTGFQKADMDSRVGAQLQALEQQVKQASDSLFKKRKELQRVANDLEDDQGRAGQVQEQLKHLSRHNENVLYALKELANEFPEMQSSLMVVLQKEKLQMPDRPPSRGSSAGGSRAGSAY